MHCVRGVVSPPPANVLLDEVDKDLERRGRRFARFADDCNVYVRSWRAGERVLQSLRRLYAKIHLKVNESKTAGDTVFGRRFLEYCLRRGAGTVVKIAVAPKAVARFKQCVREDHLPVRVAERMRQYLPGWKSYFRLAETPTTFKDLNSWIRHRLRAVQLKHWRRGPTIYSGLLPWAHHTSLPPRVAGGDSR